MRVALNIADLTRYDSVIRASLIVPVIPSQTMVNAEPKNGDGHAVVLECTEERARAIVRFLRDIPDAKGGQYPCRAYLEGPRGGWVPYAAARKEVRG